MTEHEWLASTDPAAMLKALIPDVPTLHPHGDRGHLPLPRPSDRKLRLFACSCCRQPEVWDRPTDDAPCGRCGGHGSVVMGLRRNDRCPDCHGTGRVNRSRRAVEVAERYADVDVNEAVRNSEWNRVLNANRDNPHRTPWVTVLPESCLEDPINISRLVQRAERSGIMPATQTTLLRCIVDNPFRPVTLPKSRRCKKCGWDGSGPNRKYCDRPQTFDGKVPHLWIETCSWLTHNDGAVVKLATVIYQDRQWDLMPILADALEEAGCEGERCPKCHGSGTYTVQVQNAALSAANGYGSATTYTEWRGCRHCGGDHDRKGTGRVPHSILAHLRGPGPHARGCWVLDLLLGKE